MVVRHNRIAVLLLVFSFANHVLSEGLPKSVYQPDFKLALCHLSPVITINNECKNPGTYIMSTAGWIKEKDNVTYETDRSMYKCKHPEHEDATSLGTFGSCDWIRAAVLGLNVVAGGTHVYLTGPDSPLGYHEGRFYRMFQVTMPPNSSDMWVFPYNRRFKERAVTKVTVHSTDNDTPALSAIPEGNGSTFKLRLIRNWSSSCGSEGGEKVNVIQVQAGKHASAINPNDLVIAESKEDAEFDLTAFKTTPSVFLQLTQYDDSDEDKFLNVLSYKAQQSVTVILERHPFTRVKASFDFIGIGVERQTDMFGTYALVHTATDMRATPHTKEERELSFEPLPLPGTPMVFLQAFNTREEPRVVNAELKGYEFTLKRGCSKDDTTPYQIAVDQLAINTIDFAEKESKEVAVDLRTFDVIGCPYLECAKGCVGFFRYWWKGDFRKWYQKQRGQLVYMNLGDDGKLKIGTDEVEAVCVFSDLSCHQLTGQRPINPVVGKRVSPSHWQSSGVDMRLDFADGRTAISNVSPHTYSCENSALPRGPVSGMNFITYTNVYVVTDKDMYEGLYFRMFTLELPDDERTIVYPMGHDWRPRSTATKLMVHTGGQTNVTLLPMLDQGGNTTFKISLRRENCQSSRDFKMTVRVNVLQVRLGVFEDPWGTDSIAANTNQVVALNKVDRKYEFYSSAEGKSTLHSFNQIPVLLTEVYERRGHWYNFQDVRYLQTSNITTEQYSVRLVTRMTPGSDALHNYFWIAIVTGSSGGSTLFGPAMYFRVDDSASSERKTNINYEKPGISRDPFVFIENAEAQNLDVYPMVEHATAEKTSVVLTNNCFPQKAVNVPFRGIVIAPVRGYKKPQQVDYVTCTTSMEGTSNCHFDDRYCEKVVVLSNGEYGGVYSIEQSGRLVQDLGVVRTADNWAYLSNSKHHKLMYENNQWKSEDREGKGHKFKVDQVLCVKRAEFDGEGRHTHGTRTVYNAAHKAVSTDWYTYYQIEVEDGDETSGLETYSGRHFGQYAPFATAFPNTAFGTDPTTKSDAVSVAFAGPTMMNAIVKPMIPCGKLGKTKINVLEIALNATDSASSIQVFMLDLAGATLGSDTTKGHLVVTAEKPNIYSATDLFISLTGVGRDLGNVYLHTSVTYIRKGFAAHVVGSLDAVKKLQQQGGVAVLACASPAVNKPHVGNDQVLTQFLAYGVMGTINYNSANGLMSEPTQHTFGVEEYDRLPFVLLALPDKHGLEVGSAMLTEVRKDGYQAKISGACGADVKELFASSLAFGPGRLNKGNQILP